MQLTSLVPARALVALAIALPAAMTASAQPSIDDMSLIGGTDYVVAFPDTVKNGFDTRFPNSLYEDKAILFIYSAVDTRVSITGRGYTNPSVSIQAGRFAVIDLTNPNNRAPEPIVIERCTPVDNTFRISATAPVVVYQYLATKFGTEAWTALPVDAWGTDYFVASHPGETLTDIAITPGWDTWNRGRLPAPAEFLVIAAYDSTMLDIAIDGRVVTGCDSRLVMLMAGEAYQVQSHVDTSLESPPAAQADIAGTHIRANRPIAVISGNTRAQLVDDSTELGRNSFKNMLIEQLTPVGLHGREFVSTPSMDSVGVRDILDINVQRYRPQEVVRVYGTSEGTTAVTIDDSAAARSAGSVALTGELDLWLAARPAGAALIRADKPTQVTVATPALIGRGVVLPGGTYPSYDAHGGSMVSLVPRRRWSRFAPVYASTHPAGMRHFVNVVTDSAHRNDIYVDTLRFPLPHSIAGTDLVWGTMVVRPGVDHRIAGRNGARFTGHVYGRRLNGGHEEMRPGGSSPQYEEYLAIAYAYPLASEYTVLGGGDSLEIDITNDCGGMRLVVRAVNPEPAGFQSFRLDSIVNAKIVSIDPFPPVGQTVRLRIAPIDAQKDASATIVIKDKTGRSTRVPFVYRAERLSLTPATRLDFGVMSAGDSTLDTITAVNSMDRPVIVRSIDLDMDSPAFHVVSPTVLPDTIAPGDSLAIVVRASPARPNTGYSDTLSLRLECSTWRIALSATTDAPCLTLNDLDFGTVYYGGSTPVTRQLRLCNEGSGIVTFTGPPGGGPVLEWNSGAFSVSDTALARLRLDTLDAGECTTIDVTFAATELSVGNHRDTARVWASTRACRDSSLWYGFVDEAGAVGAETGLASTLECCEPNPVSSSTTIEYTLARAGHARIDLYDERGALVTTLLDGHRDSGAHTIVLDASTLPAGTYHLRLRSGDGSLTRTIVKQ